MVWRAHYQLACLTQYYLADLLQALHRAADHQPSKSFRFQDIVSEEHRAYASYDGTITTLQSILDGECRFIPMGTKPRSRSSAVTSISSASPARCRFAPSRWC